MADLPIFRDKPNAESWDRDFIRKINALRDELESVKASSTSTSGSSSGRLTQLESKLNALEDEFQDHQNDISNFYHQVQHSQTLTAQGTTGDDNDDHDDRYYPSDNDGSDPTTNEKIFLREDVVGLSSGAVDVTASGITTDTTNFDNNLSSADDTVQKALDTLDDLAVGGGSSTSYTEETTSRTVTIPAGSTVAEAQAIVDGIGKHIHAGVTITVQFEDGTYSFTTTSLQFVGFYGGGSLFITGNEDETEDEKALHVDQKVTIVTPDMTATDSPDLAALYFSGNDLSSIDITCIKFNNMCDSSVGTSGVGGSIYIEFSGSARYYIHGNYFNGNAKYGVGIRLDQYCGAAFIHSNYITMHHFFTYLSYGNPATHYNNDDYGGSLKYPNYYIRVNANIAFRMGTQPSVNNSVDSKGNGGQVFY